MQHDESLLTRRGGHNYVFFCADLCVCMWSLKYPTLHSLALVTLTDKACVARLLRDVGVVVGWWMSAFHTFASH